MFCFPVSSYLYIFIRGIDYSIVFSLFTASCNAYSFLSCYEILVHDHATISEFNLFNVNRQFTFHNGHLNLHLFHHSSYAALDRLYLGMRSFRRSRFIF